MYKKIQKDPKENNCHFQRVGAKAGGQEKKQVLHMPPAHNTSKGVGKPPKPPLCPIPGPAPTLTPYKEPAHPYSGSEQGDLLLVLTPPLLQ